MNLTQSIPPSFRGLVWEPVCEQEVVILFARLLESDQLGLPLCLDHVRTTFPDCKAIDPTTGERVNVEFEYRSKAFFAHRREWNELRQAHPQERWLVVCWHDKLEEHRRKQFPGLAIKELRALKAARTLVLNWFPGDLDAPDAARTIFDWRASSLSPKQRAIVESLRTLAETERDFSPPEWPAESEFPKFVVWSRRQDIPCFAVSADATISVPFSKWTKVPERDRRKLIEQLNRALQTNWFSGRENSKKGCDAEALLHGGELIASFLDVWRGLSDSSLEPSASS